MLNINSLYNAVFKPEAKRFDPRDDYYTIILDTPEFAPLYGEFSSRMGYLMNTESYSYIHAEGTMPLKRTDVEERLSQIAEMLDIRTNGMPPQRRFCLMTYFETADADVSQLSQLMSWLDAGMRDVISLFVCIPKRMENVDSFLARLGETLKSQADKLDLYIFTDANTDFYRRGLLHSICGAILMNSQIKHYQERKFRLSAAVSGVEQYVSSMAEDGRKRIEKMPAIRWSSLFCRYYDRQYDFLNQYIAAACENIKILTAQGFEEELQAIYEQTVPHKDAKSIKRMLQQAVAYIPYVVPSRPKLSISTLRYYFDHVYGDRGMQTVEMTLKATLAGLIDYRMDDIVQQCCEMIFDKCADYATGDLYEKVLALLESYLDNLRKHCEASAKNIQLSLEDDIPEEAREHQLDEYLTKYVELHMKQKAISFWNLVVRTIRAYPERYKDACLRSDENYRHLEELKRSLPSNPVYRFEILERESYSAGQLLNLEHNDERCEKIRKMFNNTNGGGADIVPPSECTLVFNIPIAPHFYRGEQVRLDTTSYTLVGYEINGKYLVTMGEE